jgi:ABC-type nickel/cobalt efflux system permease component RcnA
LGGELCGAPRQKIDRDGTHGTPHDKPEPHLVCRLGPWAHQQAITGQGFGIEVRRRARQLLKLGGGLRVCPTVLVGLG